MRTPHLRWTALALAPILALALAACGDDDDGDSATPTPTTPPSTSGGAAAAEHPELPRGFTCTLLTLEEIADITGVEVAAGVHTIDGDTTICTLDGDEYEVVITLQLEATADDARTAVEEAGPGGETVAIGDAGYLIGDTMVTSSDFYLVTLTIDPHRRASPRPLDPDAHQELLTLIITRLP